MQQFEKIFTQVKPIILKLKRTYYVQLWEYDDWIQEGQITLYNLLEKEPHLLENNQKLYIYFKTKFSNYIKYVIRHQESKKRQFNRMPYEEISENGHAIAKKEMSLDDFIAYYDVLTTLENQFSLEEKEMLQKTLSGERFAGKKQFLKKISPYFKDFK